jgi:3',5'-cyclic AMP phosphodiesterase CpdA
MRTLVHLSDLHFGRVDEALIDPLIKLVTQIKPDVVVVSGDLTQRARSEQFKQARHFLDALPSPQIVVPGNHDVPLHNIFHRFARPLDKYRRYITPDLEPFYIDDEIAVVGINSARSLTLKNGRINQRQIARIQARLSTLDAHIIKIIVTHHPFDLPANYTEKEIIGRAPMAMKMFASYGADMLLAGHLHVSHAGNTAVRYAISGYAALVVQAGTATSTRGRGESNSFNVIQIDSPHISIQRFTWMPELSAFTVLITESFQRGPSGWSR